MVVDCWSEDLDFNYSADVIKAEQSSERGQKLLTKSETQSWAEQGQGIKVERRGSSDSDMSMHLAV